MIQNLYKINDFSNINEMKKNKSYKDSKVKFKISDKKKIKPILNKEYKNIIYMLATSSDKEINMRTYADDSTRELVENGGWLTPYNKPILKNHDQIDGEPQGRILDSWYIKHNDMSITSSSKNTIPEDVIKFFQDNNCFEEGTGSTILKSFVDDETMKKIKDGYYLTVSQGIYVEDLKCNICGKSIWECEHYAGEEYELEDKTKKVCIPTACGKFEAAEISIVNIPANDTSIIYIPNENTQNINDNKTNTISDSIVPKLDNNKNVILNSIKDNKNKGDEMIKDLLIASLLKDMKEIWNFDETKESEIKDFINSLEDEKIEKFVKILNSLEESTNNLIKDFNEKIEKTLKDAETIKPIVTEQSVNDKQNESITEPATQQKDNNNTEPDTENNTNQTNDDNEGSGKITEKDIKDDLEALKNILKANDDKNKETKKDSLSEMFIKNFN